MLQAPLTTQDNPPTHSRLFCISLLWNVFSVPSFSILPCILKPLFSEFVSHSFEHTVRQRGFIEPKPFRRRVYLSFIYPDSVRQAVLVQRPKTGYAYSAS
ncbi:hypothetical protein HRR83_007486 [Exophiala dermatitidis]|uniref:Uncharacterized protein n=1 Tax=Exophiala dermatitidis TaxID=5970 RepID=A0AAN6EPJ3_EXODE|nr:hypothetical protein HRR74_006932 [Exophiala dermatitidis]KAJ4510606.1 hypothetical protein HRR73_006678 [Exophiala dermatitidis]KAJ4535070.1 hypothetical protein HRR76_006970 [Exophiala dermatitidis]KAJ4536138.1 hypothetical protein HRR77_007583 [Exophiala dermatitidis]KAJ4571151.1 hypothetical protein HRR79_004064 [Exophiala dermatitidis]